MKSRGEHRTRAADVVARGAVAAFVLITFAIIARALGPAGYAGFALVYAAIAIGAAALLHHFTATPDALREPNSLWRGLLVDLFGAPLALTTFSLALLRWADRFVLVAYVEAADLGVYAAAVDFAHSAFVLLIASLYRAWLPRLVVASNDTDARVASDAAGRYALLVMALVFPALTGVALLRTDVVASVFGAEYSGQAALLPWVVLAVVLGLLRTFVLDVGLYLVGRAGAVTRNILVSAGICFTLNVLLVPRHGVWGAVVASLLAQSIALALAWFSGRDVITWRVPRMQFERIVFGCGLMVLVLLFMPRGDSFTFGARVGAAVTVYGVTMLLVNGVGFRDWLRLLLRR